MEISQLPPTTPMKTKFVSIKDLSIILGVKQSTLRHMRERGTLIKGVHYFCVTPRVLVYDSEAIERDLIRSVA